MPIASVLLVSKLKQALRSAKAREFAALIEAMSEALRSVSLSDIEGWFGNCGDETDCKKGHDLQEIALVGHFSRCSKTHWPSR